MAKKFTKLAQKPGPKTTPKKEPTTTSKTSPTTAKAVPAKQEPAPLDQPTRRTVETLLRDIAHRSWNNPSEARIQAKDLDIRIEELKEKLLDVTELKEMEKQHRDLMRKDQAYENRLQDQTKRVRELYQSEGISKNVLKELRKLVAYANKGCPPLPEIPEEPVDLAGEPEISPVFPEQNETPQEDAESVSHAVDSATDFGEEDDSGALEDKD